MVLPVGRHSLARERRKPPVALAALIAPAAMFFAVAADVHPFATEPEARPALPKVAPATTAAAPCCFEVVAAPPAMPSVEPAGAQSDTNPVAAQLVSASRYRVVDRALPPGVAPERGLQVRTILTARHISEEFPEIHEIGGVRPDALRWHPDGLALDVMIPNPSSAAGIALGDQIVAYVLQNAAVFGIQDAIWRGVYYTPGGAQRGGYGHFDHVHVTTTGGGYPTGGETYYR
jgi:hypothetical protein